MGFFRQRREQNAFQAQLSPRAFELYQSFCYWRGAMGTESVVSAMVNWANSQFRASGGFDCGEFDAMLRNNGMDVVDPQAPVTAEMFEALAGWISNGAAVPVPSPVVNAVVYAAPASTKPTISDAEGQAVLTCVLGLIGVPGGREKAELLLRRFSFTDAQIAMALADMPHS